MKGWINKKIIEPFSISQVHHSEHGQSIISYGLSSSGYDLRVVDEFKVFTNVFNTVVDPKAFDEKSFVNIQTDVCIVPSNSFTLARKPRAFPYSRRCSHYPTYTRCGIVVNVTPLEPEWEGHVTLEISNTTPLPAKIYANEGLAQLIFFGGNEICETSYADRHGKYMYQRGVTMPKA